MLDATSLRLIFRSGELARSVCEGFILVLFLLHFCFGAIGATDLEVKRREGREKEKKEKNSEKKEQNLDKMR